MNEGTWIRVYRSSTLDGQLSQICDLTGVIAYYIKRITGKGLKSYWPPVLVCCLKATDQKSTQYVIDEACRWHRSRFSLNYIMHV